jgi:hypothetical protein
MSKGTSLLLTILILSAVLAISLGISVVVVQQIKISSQIADSVLAFFAADSGMERSLYNYYKQFELKNICETQFTTDCTLENQGKYQVTYVFDETGATPKTLVKSLGIYGKTSRGIETTIIGTPELLGPTIENALIDPRSGLPGTIFTISATISDTSGVDPNTTIAIIKDDSLNEIAIENMVLIGGDEFSGDYQASWDSAGYCFDPEGCAYYADIEACDIFGICSKVENI